MNPGKKPVERENFKSNAVATSGAVAVALECDLGLSADGWRFDSGGKRENVLKAGVQPAGQTGADGHLSLSPKVARKNIAKEPEFWLHSAMPESTEPAGAAKAARCRMRILYSGTVQGVGFRYTAKSVASGFEVTGVVRNLPDGRVELVAEGLRAELQIFRQAIRDEGLGHFIRDEQVEWSEAQGGLRGFEISR